MTQTMTAVLIAVGGTLIANLAMAEPLMKAGLWEQRVTKQTMDGKDMMAQMAGAQAQMQQALANMPPERRQQMEALMARHGNQAKGFRICVSPEMAARDKPNFSGKHKCEPTNVVRNGNRMTFDINCKTPTGTNVGKVETLFKGDTSEFKMDLVETNARGKHTIHMEQTSTYLGRDCQGIKPADQIAAGGQESRKK